MPERVGAEIQKRKSVVTHFKPALGLSVAAILVSAPAAFADVSAADVWGQWKDYIGRSGQTMSVGSEDQSGGTLTVKNLKMSLDAPEMSYSATLDEVAFTENGDGTVSVKMPDEFPIVLDIHPADKPPAKVTLKVDNSELAVTASGTPDAISYAYSADSIAVALDSFEAPEAEDATADVTVEINTLSGSYSFAAGDVQPFTSSMDAAGMTIDATVTGPSSQGGGTFKFNGNVADLKSESTGAMPRGMDYADMSKAVAAGFAAKGNFSFGASSYDADFQDATDNFTGSAKLASGGLDVAISSDGLAYEEHGKELDVTLSGSSIPVPQIALKMAEAAFGLTMPITKSDTPQAAALLVKLVDFSINDEIWGMIDPGAALPHDPATLVVDLKGKMNWLIDIMSPDAEAQMGMSHDMPAKIYELNVDALQAKIAGADLTGNGGFTFDNNDMTTWGGMPAPDGKLDLQLVGGNGLLDKLVSMGLVPQEQAMGFKMMLGMFAKPGAGDDTLTSTIEVKKNGSVFANGQQLK